ncbi:hypothetical protein LTR95_017492, partial [Oleoguttula sp. CCFEE 5521]
MAQSTLLGLPAELRVEILVHYFTVCLPSPHPKRANRISSYTGPQARYLKGVAVLHICRQLRVEDFQLFEQSLAAEIRHWAANLGAARTRPVTLLDGKERVICATAHAQNQYELV